VPDATPLPPVRGRGPRLPRAARRGGAFLARWGISLASLASGFATLVVFRRGVPHVGWIVGYVVVLWLLFAVLSQAREALLARGRRVLVVAGDYTIQTLYHGLLLFVLPGYFASTTFDGPTAVFFVALAAAALLTTVDPWYRAVVHPRPRLGTAFFVVALFAGLNVALPLIGVPPGTAVLASAALAVVGLAPAHVRAGASARGALGRLAATAALAVGLAWVALPLIPPAPVHLLGATLARGVVDREPVEPVARLTEAELRAWGELVAFTPVVAPAGLRQPIEHRWRHEGRIVSTVRLATPVQGGRTTGFRTFSRKRDFPAAAAGRWTVDVLTASGQLVGRLRFRVDA
jgi:hypothetical protein